MPMTMDEQDAIIGRLVREKRDFDIRLAALEAKAHQISERLRTLSGAARGDLSGIQLEGEGLDADQVFRRTATWIKREHLNDAATLIEIANEYRQAKEAQTRIASQLAQAGWR
jgi:hypothetical protein